MGINYVSAIIVAAGNSTRMGLDISKQFIQLLDHYVIEYTIKAFEDAQTIDEIIVVCRPSDRIKFQKLIDQNSFSKVVAFADGGETRTDSVENGLKAVSKKTTHIAIHDGARPLILSQNINKVVVSAISSNAAALGVPVNDTVKVVDDNNIIVSTPKRSTLRAVQTPQVFEKELYIRAIQNAKAKGLTVTDDCQLVEEMGEPVEIVQGCPTNIKLTTKSDITFAVSILKTRQ